MMNVFSEEMRRNPFSMYDHLRSESPVLRVAEADAWMVFDYDGVKRVLTEHESFSSLMSTAGRGNPEWFIFFDPPRHTRMRGLVLRAFTPRVVTALEPRIRELSRTLLDRIVERGTMDLVADYSAPLPMLVIAEMLGIPVEDRPRFNAWSDVILNLSYDLSGGERAQRASQAYTAAKAEMSAYLEGLLRERGASPRDYLLSRLVGADVDGERLTHEEILGFFQLLIVAGTETTTNVLNNAILCFLEHPQQLARVQRDPALLPSAIEEVLRYRSPVQWMFRATTRAVELHGETIPPGKLVLPVIGSANRDPRHFPEAERFDVGRDPNPHIAFGHGIHFCLGAPLSRLESRIALADLLTRLDHLERVSDEPWEPRKALHVHGPERLPIRFTPAPAR